MKLLRGLQADRLIQQMSTLADPSGPEARKLADKLVDTGPAAIPKILEAVKDASRDQTVAFVEILGRLIDAGSLRYFREALASPSPRILQAVTWALSGRRSYDPSQLLDLLEAPDVNKTRVIEVLDAHKDRLDPRTLLPYAYELEPKDKANLLRIVNDLAREDLVPELIERLSGKDERVRVHLIEILSRFPRPDVSAALERQLRDRNKAVRQAALDALSNMPGAGSIGRVCEMLCDPELDVQSKAVDAIVSMNHPDTARHLVEVLKDENEYARRAAVEVLNEIGTADNIKELLMALKDDDWWVRSRATDALANIGGPRVVEAVLSLFKDEDEEIRRSAIEIINTVKDERTFSYLIEATRDPDWWVRERAADALVGLGNRKAVPALVEMLQAHPRSIPIALRALAQLGDHKIVNAVLPMLERPEKDVKIEALNTLACLAGDAEAAAVRTQIVAQQGSGDPDVEAAVEQALTEIAARVSPTAIAARERAEQLAEPQRTLLIDAQEVAEIAQEAQRAEPARQLDIATLEPGDLLDDRYRYIQQIGRGAFGTVILVEDTVVGERLVLKFLNKNIAEDQEMMQRFIFELRNSRKITHKNVIRLYDFIYLGGLYAISMEYFPSHPLGSEVAQKRPVELKRALRIAFDIATGMAVAHQADIVHRDLKPANILINNEDLVKIVDFGVSAALNADTHLTRTGYVIGSPKYMAPEQILGKEIDQRCDIYSLGVILYELLTGIPPYADGDQMSVMYQHVQGRAAPVREANPQVRPEISDLVSRMMAVDKLKRFQTMEDVRRAIRDSLH